MTAWMIVPVFGMLWALIGAVVTFGQVGKTGLPRGWRAGYAVLFLANILTLGVCASALRWMWLLNGGAQ